MRLILVLVALVYLAFPVKAEGINVGLLYDACTAREESAEWMYCYGVITGFGRVLSLNGSLVENDRGSPELQKLAVCPPDGEASPAAMMQVFRNWAEAHPEDWGKSFEVGIIQAVTSVWPC